MRSLTGNLKRDREYLSADLKNWVKNPPGFGWEVAMNRAINKFRDLHGEAEAQRMIQKFWLDTKYGVSL